MMFRYDNFLLSIGCFIFVINIAVSSQETISKESIRNEFYKRLGDWHEYVHKNHPSFLMESEVISSFEEIIELGPPALPYIVEVMKDKETYPAAHQLIFQAMKKITKKEFSPDSLNLIERSSSKKNTELWLVWWEEGRDQTPQQFQTTFEKWKMLQKGEEKQKIFKEILNLGIGAIPLAMEKIEQGETNLIEAINYWTDDALAAAVDEADVEAENMPQFVSQWWEENKEQWTLPEIEE